MEDVAASPTETLAPNPQNPDAKPPEKEPDPLAASPTPVDAFPAPVSRESEVKEKRDEREPERPVSHRGGENEERGKLPPSREREIKRRASRSPSPAPNRERRRSPPPAYKRSRREDGGYGGGRDRRNGYDGGYHRGPGGRHLYAADRPYRRENDRGYPGGLHGDHWDSSHGGGGYHNGPNTGLKREGLMTYKQFIQELEDDILPSEAERRYQEYKSEYITTQKKTYFGSHKDEEWRKDHAQKAAHNFLLELRDGSLNLGPDVNGSLKKSAHLDNSDFNKETEAGGNRRDNNKASANGNAPKVHPISSDPRRVLVDIEQAQALIRKLDSEKGVAENILGGKDNEDNRGSTGPVIIVRGLNFVKGLEGTELLDTLTTYLWRIHGLDYYGMVETSEPKGLRHVRSDARISESNNSDGAEWGKSLDTHWKKRLATQDPLELMTGKEKIDAAAVQALDPFVRKIRDEKYGWKFGCGAKGCTKLFHAPEFVHKHLKLKHPELVVDLTSKLQDDMYFENYMSDPNAPGGKPIMQQSFTDKPQDRKQGIQSRLRDDRASHRDRDFRASGGERHERNGNMERYDGPTFSSDVAPPILMPVPGAGPLGPFVPAPPDVARQMLREQGGPPSYGGGRNGHPMAQATGGAPLLLSQPFGRDPRQMRSYNDLDAPEDEVPVLDYRTL